MTIERARPDCSVVHYDVEKDNSRHYARGEVFDAVAEEAETKGRQRDSEFAAK